MTARLLPAVALGCVLTCFATAGPAEDAAERPVSGVYPHLAVTNGGATEAGIGAIAAWAGKLWYVTYPAHAFDGSNDKLYELDSALHLTARKESVGGTHAGRMIHRESNQLILGPYFIDAEGRVRAIPPRVMPGRITAVARHLKDPANKVYFATMEQGFYEVDVHSLAVTVLHEDGNVGGRLFLPGTHGKGCYTGQGRLVFANNGEGGVLAEWDGSKDLAAPGAWTIIDRNKYTDVTGPGGIFGAPDDKAPIWAIGWDSRSVLLNVRDGGRWTRFRLPKASYTQDADHGWFTEWPRIREVGDGHYLMNMHDMFYDLPGDFRPSNAGGLQPLSTFLKMVVDYTADWNGQLVMANNDATRQGNPILLCPQSNLWFGDWGYVGLAFGRPAGWGGPWVADDVKAGKPSDPFLMAGFQHRVVHLAHREPEPVTFTLEVDEVGNGNWSKYASVTVPARGAAYHVIPPAIAGEWIRLTTDRDARAATAYFHFSPNNPWGSGESCFSLSIPRAGLTGPQSEGILQPGRGMGMPLCFAATVVDKSGRTGETGYYVMGADLKLRRTAGDAVEKNMRKRWAPTQDFEVDAASVIMKDARGKRYRLPKGAECFSRPAASGPRRGIREVVTERNLMNIHGTFYEMPRADSGGLAKIRPITTHNRQIYDFASWRGLLVMSGAWADWRTDEHCVASDDGKVNLWLGNLEDLWRLGQPRGEGGPWHDTDVLAGKPSDPYLMTGYENKELRLSHDRPEAVRFTVEIDFLANGTWHRYETLAVAPGQTARHVFPDGFAAHWVRVTADADCKATAWFRYNMR